MVRVRFVVRGQVQGVGFRPFVFRLAKGFGLTGYVKNHYEGVEIVVEGEGEAVEDFACALSTKYPPMARIIGIEREEIVGKDVFEGFTIERSEIGERHEVLISPDIATCTDCLKELFDPGDRRFLFPFINCTNCGPRFTITRSIPYDRGVTSMACFEMCGECREEYEDPLDRRFHAQPNCCHLCGPEVWLQDRKGRVIDRGVKAIEYAASYLSQGKILAIKGLGGFHISCCADSEEVIALLRRLKMRPSKPLAIMAACIEDLRGLVSFSDEEKGHLEGHIRPIVLLKRAPSSPLPSNIAPDTDEIGVMLPYTPLHHVLFYFLKKYLPPHRLPLLIMTSGNRASEPICIGNREAVERLEGLVSFFLLHNRDILIRCDDSVVRVKKGRLFFYRRARGFVPSPISLSKRFPCVLAVGAELKNTICLIKGAHAFVSQYIGDLKNLNTYEYFQETIQHYQKILKVSPRAICADMHPDYLSTRFAMEQGKEVIRVQHHHAHILATMADRGIEAPVIGLALDGVGLGTDGTVWGGEVLFVEKDLSFKRLAHLYPVRMPGGDVASVEIWRMALSYLLEIGGDVDKFIHEVQPRRGDVILEMVRKGVNSPITTSCGRLFDAVSSLLGIKRVVTYEGEGAVALEHIQDRGVDSSYPMGICAQSGGYVMDSREIVAAVVEDIGKGEKPSVISRRFHLGLAASLAQTAYLISRDVGIKKVVGGGGVFQNMALVEALEREMTKRGMELVLPSHLSPNDESISLGQAYLGVHRLG